MSNTTPQMQIFHALTELGIDYACHRHEPVFSMDDCLALSFVQQDMEFPKNLLLTSGQGKTLVLLMMSPHKPFQTRIVSKLLGVSRLSFAPPSVMSERLHTRPGALSPLGLLLSEDRNLLFALDCDIMTYNRIAMHPCDPTQTIVMSTLDFLSVLLPALGCPYRAIQIPEDAITA